jgi:hypothetical protein
MVPAYPEHYIPHGQELSPCNGAAPFKGGIAIGPYAFVLFAPAIHLSMKLVFQGEEGLLEDPGFAGVAERLC